jgi:hypothetical protein
MSVHSKARHRAVARKPNGDPTVTGTAVLVDIQCAVAMEVAHTASRAGEHASILESIGSRAFEAAGVLRRDASSHELLRKAHEVRGLVAHALGVLADLQFQAGRMQALAAIREAEGSCDEE